MAKKQDGPLVIRGARLTDGVTVWLDHRGDWSERVDDARIAADDDARAALTTIAQAAVANNLIVDFEPAPVASAEKPDLIIGKDRIRAAGPTVRLDLGPQAETTPEREAA